MSKFVSSDGEAKPSALPLKNNALSTDSESAQTNSNPSIIRKGEDLGTATETLPTNGQLMRATAQAIQQLYHKQLGYAPRRVTCHIVAGKLVAWLEDSITPVESFVASVKKERFQQVRSVINNILREKLRQVLKESLQVEVKAVLIDDCCEQNCTGMIALLASSPRVRPSR